MGGIYLDNEGKLKMRNNELLFRCSTPVYWWPLDNIYQLSASTGNNIITVNYPGNISYIPDRNGVTGGSIQYIKGPGTTFWSTGNWKSSVPSLDPFNDYTLSFWFKLGWNSIYFGDWGHISNYLEINPAPNEWTQIYNFDTYDSGTTLLEFNITGLSNDVWYFYAATHNSNLGINNYYLGNYNTEPQLVISYSNYNNPTRLGILEGAVYSALYIHDLILFDNDLNINEIISIYNNT